MKKAIFIIVITALYLTCIGQEPIKTCRVNFKSAMRVNPVPGDEIITLISKGSNVDVLDFKDGFYKIRYNGEVGYVTDISINDPELTAYFQSRAEAERLAEEAGVQAKIQQEKEEAIKKEEEARMRRAEEEKRIAAEKEANRIQEAERAAKFEKEMEEYKKGLIKIYGTKKADLMLSGTIQIGWTTDEVLISWGKPDDINKTINASGVKEQWVYKVSAYKSKYIYFNNNILETIQE